MKEKHSGTMLVFVTLMVILFLIYRNIYFLYGSLLLSFIGIFIPALSKQIHVLWMKFAELLGKFMNKVILSLVFFIVVVPFAAVSKLFRKSPFRKRDLKIKSYFTERNYTYTPESLEQMW